jgi:hypothetical protein
MESAGDGGAAVMSFISITDTQIHQIESYTGLHFSPEIKADRMTVLRLLKGVGVDVSQTDLLLTIEMPCGEKYYFATIWDFPLRDVRCRCGNPQHYVVRWEGRITSLETLLRERNDE